MNITGYIWYEDVLEKLDREHGVRQQEVREVFADLPHYRFVEKGHRADENVYAALGETNGGRYLIVFFVRKKDGRALILSARDMTRNERRDYGQK